MPFAGPFAVEDDRALAAMLEARRERRLVDVAIERPTIRQRVHFLAGRAPMEVAAGGAAQDRADLAHDSARCQFAVVEEAVIALHRDRTRSGRTSHAVLVDVKCSVLGSTMA